jgi:hypothetical protein
VLSKRQRRQRAVVADASELGDDVDHVDLGAIQVKGRAEPQIRVTTAAVAGLH